MPNFVIYCEKCQFLDQFDNFCQNLNFFQKFRIFRKFTKIYTKYIKVWRFIFLQCNKTHLLLPNGWDIIIFNAEVKFNSCTFWILNLEWKMLFWIFYEAKFSKCFPAQEVNSHLNDFYMSFLFNTEFDNLKYLYFFYKDDIIFHVLKIIDIFGSNTHWIRKLNISDLFWAGKLTLYK